MNECRRLCLYRMPDGTEIEMVRVPRGNSPECPTAVMKTGEGLEPDEKIFPAP